ncbi:MAG: RrF2 family transcriptional regulator [Planctomycetota bacterium]|jgi:Rrf2 family protein
MLFTRKTDYALVALAGLAHAGAGGASARELADSLHLPLPVLRNILKRLAAHGLLMSSRGPSGGYRLARKPDEITLAQVVDVIEGPVQLLRCCPVPAGQEPRCQLEDSCRIKSNVQRVHDGLMGYLNGVTLAEITNNERLEQPAAEAVVGWSERR